MAEDLNHLGHSRVGTFSFGHQRIDLLLDAADADRQGL
jgi:hypothetical protein